MLVPAHISLEPWWLIWGSLGLDRGATGEMPSSQREKERVPWLLSSSPTPLFSWDLPLAKPEVSLWVSAPNYTEETNGKMNNRYANLGGSGLAWYTIAINIQGSIYTLQLLEAGIEAEGDEINGSNIQSL